MMIDKLNVDKGNVFFILLVVLVFFIFPASKAVGTVGSFLLFLFGLFFFIKDCYNDPGKLKFLKISSPLLFLFLIICVGLIYGEASYTEKIDYFVKSLRFPAIFFAGYLLYKFNLSDIAIKCFSASMLMTLLMVYVSIFIPLPWAKNVPQEWGGNQTIWGDYITQNIMMSFFALIVFHKAFEEKANKYIFFVLFFLSAWAILTLSFGRTGYVMLFSSIIGYIFLKFENWKIRFLVIVISFAVAVAAYFFVDLFRARVDLAYMQFVTADDKTLNSVGARLLMWKTAFKIGVDNFWFGVGSGAYELEWCARVVGEEWCAVGKHPHNQFLLIFASNGFFAFLGYFCFFIICFYFSFKRIKFSELFFGFLTILIVDSFLNAPFWNVREANFFTLIASVFFAKILFELEAN